MCLRPSLLAVTYLIYSMPLDTEAVIDATYDFYTDTAAMR